VGGGAGGFVGGPLFLHFALGDGGLFWGGIWLICNMYVGY